jgi:hypothetical protein
VRGQPKYKAQKTVCAAGHKHDSKAEAARCDDLHGLQAAGHLYGLEQQPVFRVEIGGKLMCRYVADFAWQVGGARVVEDVKGVVTPMFNLKKKLVEATHPGVVITVYPPRKRKARKAKAK